MLSSSEFVKQSLALHLFFARIMKEHAIFLEASFTPKNKLLAQQADSLKLRIEGLLSRAVALSNGVVDPSVLLSGEVITPYTLNAENVTQNLTGIKINTKITQDEMQLTGSGRMENNPVLDQRVIVLNDNENSELAKSLMETTAVAQKLASEANERLAEQNEKTAALLNDAVNKMELNTENAAKAVLAEFSTNLNATTESISNTVTTLKDIAENINSSATNFSSGIDHIYKDFGSDLDKNLNSVTSNISASISAEYQKIVTSAQSYSNSFTESINGLNTSLDQQIGGLKTITDQLNHNVLSFKNDVDMSSSKFEVGMERSISAALEQMDASLAEIVKRLVTVTVNIQEAADALPKAVKAVKDIN
jgi:uncharacterized phage infection (PIP) family protein YhgE